MKLKTYILALATLLVYSSCEKDDVCVENDSVYVNLVFYDVEDGSTAKSVSGFSLLDLNGDIVRNYDNTTVASIALVLPTSQSSYDLILQKRTEVDGLTINTNDTLNFNYTPKATYVSRACGYIRTYTDLSIDSTSNWISGVIVNTPEINSNNEEHVAILH
ncbi:MAG: Uncharacterised protein [Flavobacteriaceae bacterium]|jgi:hypothetical protein|nr:MAG: Uncharacterised protein [Flavobacteriaceae bacterium]